jgi:arsenate reductase-like glutaredoxin family protein
MTAVTIYHNPARGTSRNTLALIRNAGVEPIVIEYLKNPPDRATLQSLISRMGVRARELLRHLSPSIAPKRDFSRVYLTVDSALVARKRSFEMTIALTLECQYRA